MKNIEETLPSAIDNYGYWDDSYGKYHPSTISGCPLQSFLDDMTDTGVTLSSWIFAGSAVHYYLQKTGILKHALHEAGYHILDTQFEVPKQYPITDDVTITGTCDVLSIANTSSHGRTIFDLKYSSLSPGSNHGRIYKYLSQTNTYAHMFDADHYGLIMISSRSNNLMDNIAVVPGEKSEDNWELVKRKALMIHEALETFGFPDGERFDMNLLDQEGKTFWRDVLDIIDRKQCPAYDEECDHCAHSDYCPVYNGTLGGGVSQFRGGEDE